MKRKAEDLVAKKDVELVRRESDHGNGARPVVFHLLKN